MKEYVTETGNKRLSELCYGSVFIDEYYETLNSTGVNNWNIALLVLSVLVGEYSYEMKRSTMTSDFITGTFNPLVPSKMKIRG